jgi:hypothetical protein
MRTFTTSKKEHENTVAVLNSGIRVEVWGWRKLKTGMAARKVLIHIH